jgi:hypothetical protein
LYKPCIPTVLSYSNISAIGVQQFGSTVEFRIPNYGQFICDGFFHITIGALSTTSSLDRVKYAEFLGHRLLKKVKFICDNTQLDSYSTEEYNRYYHFDLNESDKFAWKQTVAQETSNVAYLIHDPTNQNIRQKVEIMSGEQTLRNSHDQIELYIPHLFWFKDASKAFPIMNIKNGAMTMEIDLELFSNLVASVNNGGGGTYNTPTISIELILNYVYIEKNIFDIYFNHKDEYLITVHKYFSQELNMSSGDIPLNPIKFPTKALYCAFRPKSNLSVVDDWHKNYVITNNTLDVPVYNSVGGVPTLALQQVQYQTETDTVSSMSMNFGPITLFPTNLSKFYNTATPMFRGHLLNNPSVRGWYFFQFSNDPKKDQPQGHLNFSLILNTNLHYVSSWINSTNVAVAYIHAENYIKMIIDSGVAVLMSV